MKLLNALKGQNTGRPPLWLMRQAGRYLPEYRALREKYDFMTLCRTPELIYEVTMQPLRRFNFDAAILFSDILMIPDAMGLGLYFEEEKGPLFKKTVNNAADVAELQIPQPLSHIAKGIRLLKQDLDRPLLGFAGAPFTVASYMIEGGSSAKLTKTKTWMLHDPTSFHTLLKKITTATINHLQLQIDAGVDAVQLFDSWAGLLAYPQFQEFSIHYLNEIKSALPSSIPLIFFCKGMFPFTYTTAAISLSSAIPLTFARQHLGPHTPLQGNLDPEILLAPKETVIRETQKLLQDFANDPAWIFNLGHGVLPNTPLENVYALRDTVFNH